MDCGAEFSRSMLHRFTLWRAWGDGPRVAFIGMNPSTATATENDPTVTRCINYARDWGFAGMFMLNVMAWRQTDPRLLPPSDLDVAPGENLLAIFRTVELVRSAGGLVVCAWGAHRRVVRLVAAQGLVERVGPPVYVLGLTKDGHPRHPLYMRRDLRPARWDPHAG